MTAGQLLISIRKVDALTAAQDAIAATEKPMEEAQRTQLFQGLRSDDAPILPPYTNFTVKIKTEKGQPTDRVTLKDTGDYYAGIDVHVIGDKYQIFSVDPKEQELEEKYGPLILGLGFAARVEYIRTLKPELMKQVKTQMK